MKQGTQIAYVPSNAERDIRHPDVEFGFVTSEHENAHFCRYWSKIHFGSLRTLANSELTPNERLVEYKTVPQSIVENWLVEIGVKCDNGMKL